jgi:hypothetical protein
MSWTQIKGLSRDPDLTEALQARIADPLWMLLRQWQFGAFQGEDAATPFQLELEWQTVPVDHMTTDGKTYHALKADSHPIEPYVEAEPVAAGQASDRLALDLAMDLLSRLPAVLRKEVRQVLRDAHPLEVDWDDPILLATADGAFDPRDLMRLPKDDRLDRFLSLFRPAPPTGLADAARAWLDYAANRFVEPPTKGAAAWRPQHLDYSFGLRASELDIDLPAESYDGLRFDWYSVDFQNPAGTAYKLPDKPSPAAPLVSRVRYAGMPSRKFWEFEDHKVNFGGYRGGATDLAQSLLVEFATVYSDDWYIAPLRAPNGHLVRVNKVLVRDVMSSKPREVKSAAQKDGVKRNWRFFELTGDASPEKAQTAPWLYLPRVAAGGMQGKDLEDVRMQRDEAANLAWGIERIVETGSGRRKDRASQWSRIRHHFARAEREADDDRWLYLLETETPPFFIPYQPLIKDNRPTGRLVRSRMSFWERWPEELAREAGLQGRILDPGGAHVLTEGAMPRGGLQLVRRYQTTRGADGSLLVWVGRQRRFAGPPVPGTRNTDIMFDADGQPVDASKDRGVKP